MKRREFNKALLGAPLAAVPGWAMETQASESLDAIARTKGMRFGTALGISPSGTRKTSRFHDERYRDLIARECGELVAENETKWQSLRPGPGEFRFAQADEMFAWARGNGMLLRGHTLIWQPPKWMPRWVNEYDFGAQPAKEAERLLTEHVSTVCNHFGTTIHSYDVVNEAVDPKTGEPRSNVFTERLGAIDQLDLMFRLAKQYAPHAQLVYNDYMSWGDGYVKHRAGVLKLLAEFRKRGTPVDALGLQSHIGSTEDGREPPSGDAHVREWRRFLDEVTAMGYDLLITEFDVHDEHFPADFAARDAAVASLARTYLDVTLSYPRLRTMMTWGFADPASWLQDRYPRADGLPKRPLPYDADLKAKALRAAIADAMRAMPPRADVTRYRNPILPGFHADPSAVRVGGDYYLVTSSFEYFPGVPVHHSRDLVNWRQVGNALTRESQVKLAGQKSSKGVFAPTLRHHAGTYYMITSNIDNGGDFYVHTKDPAGEWSEPVWVRQKDWSMDPSLFFDDDGKVYYTRHGGGRNGGIYQSEIDIGTGKLAEEPRLVWPGTGGIWPEGPHLYRKDGFYYLLISEGGTSYGHMLTVARATSPWGPFEANPANPILTHRERPDLALQAVGHADLFQSADGNWWIVLLGIRPVNRHHHIGRETLLAPVTWKDGWPVVNGGAPLAIEMDAPLPRAAPWPREPVRDEFDAPRLGVQWAHLRTSAADLWTLTERRGVLRLKGSQQTLDDIATPAFAARRQEHLRMRAATQLEFVPTAESQSAGLVLRQDESNHYELRVTGARSRRVELVTRVAAATSIQRAFAVEAGDVRLQVESFPDRYEFAFAAGADPFRAIGSAPTRPLSSEETGGFTGVFVGVYASGPAPMPPADFKWFDYEPLE
jgi:alpha-N-arabinofuranosidase